MEQGGAPVHLLLDGLADGLVLLAHHLQLHLAGAQHQGLVQGEGVQQHHHQAVKHLLHVGEQGLEQQDAAVKGVQGQGNRDFQLFLQHQGRDIHAARGGAGPDDNAHACADHHPGQDGGQQRVIGEVYVPNGPLEHRQDERVIKRADDCS